MHDAVRRRCLAVVDSHAPDSELRKAAERMLDKENREELREQQRQEKAARQAVQPSIASHLAGWTCAQCTLQNSGAALVCTACAAPKPQAHAAWVCRNCTLVNDGKTCRACKAPAAKRPRAARPAPDEEDDGDFQ